MAAALMEDLIGEVLLRIQPDDPASLVRAALVSKQWCRLVCDRGFRRRFCMFHGTPTLLGLICQRDFAPFERFFAPLSSFRPCDHTDRRNMKALHSSHGRVVLHSAYWSSGKMAQDLFVWDPILDNLRKLPRWPLYSHSWRTDCNAAVLCAGAVADGCNNLDCHRGPFIVVFAGTHYAETFTCVYSSETDRWSDPVYAEYSYSGFEMGNSVIVGSAVYFKCWFRSTEGFAILKHDLVTHEASPVSRLSSYRAIQYHLNQQAVLIAMDGRLGCALTLLTSEGTKLYLWSREHGPDEDARWELSIVMDLDKLLQTKLTRTQVVVFADNGADGGVIFILSSDRLFSIDMKSGSSKVVGKIFGTGRIVPFMCFCTPALGAVSVEEGPGASEPSAKEKLKL